MNQPSPASTTLKFGERPDSDRAETRRTSQPGSLQDRVVGVVLRQTTEQRARRERRREWRRAVLGPTARFRLRRVLLTQRSPTAGVLALVCHARPA